jgi:hypothetical protein
VNGRARARWYVGICGARARQTFRSAALPTKDTHPEYGAVIGPFQTKRGAWFAAMNPWSVCISVAEYERAARLRASKG